MKCSGLNCPMQYPYDVENCRCVDTCPYATKIPYTNADKTRAMSDEELRTFSSELTFVSVVSMKKTEYVITSVLIQTFRFMKGASKLH